MKLACLIAVLAVVIAVIIIGIRQKLWGLVVMAAGAVGGSLSYLVRKVYLAFADNPGIIWQDPSGVPYSNIYTGQADSVTKWLIVSAVVTAVGLVLLVLELLKRRKK